MRRRRRRHQRTASVVAADARNAPRTRPDDVGPGAVGPRLEDDDDAPPGRLEAPPRPTGRARRRRRNDATATATRTLETRPRGPAVSSFPRVRAPSSARRTPRKSRLSAPPAARGAKVRPMANGTPDGAAHRPAAGMPPRTATGRRRRWLLAAGVGCVRVDPSRPAPSRVTRPPSSTRHTAPIQSIDRQTHRPPILSLPQVRRRAGRVRREAGVPRRHRRGPRVRRPVAPSEEEEGEKAHPSDDDDDDDEGDDDPSSRPTPGPAHSTANGDVPPTPIGKKGALQQAAAAAAASTTPPCTPPGGPSARVHTGGMARQAHG